MFTYPVSSIPEFSKKWSDVLLENINNYKEICTFGDININALNDKFNSVKNYLNQIIDHGPTNIIFCDPTWLNKLGETLIDQLLVYVQNKLLSSVSFCQIYLIILHFK